VVSKKLAKTAQERAVAQVASRASVVVRPGVALTGELGLSVALYAAASPESLAWMTPALALSTTGLSALIWQTGRDKSMWGRVLSVGSTALTGAHLIASSIVGPFTSPMLGLWLWGGGTVAAAWAVRLWIARNDATVEGTKKQVSLWDEASKKTGGALEGSAFRPEEVTGDRMTGRLQLEAGQTMQDAQMTLPVLESVLGLPPGGARLTRDPEHAARGELTLVRKNVLRETLPYRGPSAVGGSPAQPYRVGRYEHGRDAVLPLHIPGRGEVHLIIQGMTGSGKTKGAHMVFAEEFARLETFTIYVDTVKGAQSLGPLARGIRWAIRTEAEARALMKVLKQRVIPACAQYLGSRGLENWEPGCGYPRIRIHVEEGAGLFLGDEAFIRVMERARSVGLQVTLSAQRFSYTTLPVAARSQFGAVLCFGVQDVEDAKFAMPDEVFEAGADPSRWRNKMPGLCYLVAPGVEEDDYVVPLRVELPERKQLETLAEYARIHGADLPGWLADAFGELYATRVPVEEMLAEGAVVYAVDEDEEDDLDGEDAPQPWAPSEEDPAPDVQPGIDDPMEPPAATGMRFGQRGSATPEEALAMLEARLVALQQEGRPEVKASDFGEVARAAGRSPAWVYKKLYARVESGHLVKSDAGFRFARSLASTG
jgi:hypothetical protein